MLILFVCTGNICRSPMGELLLGRYLSGTTISVASAGTRGLTRHEMDRYSARLMRSVDIEPSGFRSRRLTKAMAEQADLILCFEKNQRKDIVTLAPNAVRYTFLVDDFANMCQYCAQQGLVEGLTVQERLESVVRASTIIRPMLPKTKDIEDPLGKPFATFVKVANELNRDLCAILNALKKRRQVDSAPVRQQIVQ